VNCTRNLNNESILKRLPKSVNAPRENENKVKKYCEKERQGKKDLSKPWSTLCTCSYYILWPCLMAFQVFKSYIHEENATTKNDDGKIK
jgi:hypothetical protein